MKFIVMDFGYNTVTVTIDTILDKDLEFNKKLREITEKQCNNIIKTSGSFESKMVTYHLEREITEEEAEEISTHINNL